LLWFGKKVADFRIRLFGRTHDKEDYRVVKLFSAHFHIGIWDVGSDAFPFAS
jgi:hypothetical protein